MMNLYRMLPAICCIAFIGTLPSDGAEEIATWLSVPEGFKVTRFADDDLASDIYCMTFDAQGRAVVAGQDYIRVLVDDDNDGRADRAIPFSKTGLRGGIQGLCADGPYLYATGGGGVHRFTDSNFDGVADGLPQLIYGVKTGGEHDAHAIRKGPDGKWYMIAGNYAGITKKAINTVTSPVRDPRAGVLMRFSNDWSLREVVFNGLRNSYDFDFDSDSDAFAYDSDGERDISLPWYRPTRVFHMAPGGDAGWSTTSWKAPNYFYEMPAVVAEAGRGSPTGVVCYRHNQFPEKYRDSLFVLDWTFGRLINVRVGKVNGEMNGESVNFMEGRDTFGFAPTDLEIAPDGSLYVCVGGRGTRGSVYRITYEGGADAKQTFDSQLDECLSAPQPLTAWSRKKWEPIAKNLGKSVFIKTVTDETRTVSQRKRACEIIADVFGTMSKSEWVALTSVNNDAVLAKVGWLLGRIGNNQATPDYFVALMQSDSPNVRRATIDSLCGIRSMHPKTGTALLYNLQHSVRDVRKSATRCLTSSRLTLPRIKQGEGPAVLYPSEWVSLTQVKDRVSAKSFKAGLAFLAVANNEEEKVDAIRLLQMAMGDLGKRTGVDAVFHGYSSKKQSGPGAVVDQKTKTEFVNLFPTDQSQIDWELARTYGMMGLSDSQLVDRMVAKITSESHPVSDIHYLICSAQIGGERSDKALNAIASGFAGLQSKIDTLELNQDRNWEERIRETFRQHKKFSNQIGNALVNSKSFGHPVHSLFLKELSNLQKRVAAARFAANSEQEWNAEIFRLLATSGKAEYVSLVRGKFDDPMYRDDVILSLSKKPVNQDRKFYVYGLTSPNLDVIDASISSLTKLPNNRDQQEQVALVKSAIRLAGSDREYKLRDRMIRRLQSNMRTGFGYVIGSKSPQTAAIEKWKQRVIRDYPDAKGSFEAIGELSESEIMSLLSTVPWNSGDSTRGQTIYNQVSCAKCHGKRNRLGPDLAGVSRRFSRNDLFIAIMQPSKQVSSRYRTKLYETSSGLSYEGMVIYEAVDGTLLRTANNETIRIEGSEIEHSEFLTKSLMPAGLLNDLKPQDYADLYAYLKGL